MYNEHIGREVTVTRKLKEMVTAVRLERRYTKREIIEMYLEHGRACVQCLRHRSSGADAWKSAMSSKLEAATLVGMLQNPSSITLSAFDRTQMRRNVIQPDGSPWAHHRRPVRGVAVQPIELDFRSSEVTQVSRPTLPNMSETGCGTGGARTVIIFIPMLIVHTTLDSRLQELHGWPKRRWKAPGGEFRVSCLNGYYWVRRRTSTSGRTDTPFDHFWRTRTDRQQLYPNTDRFRALRDDGTATESAVAQWGGSGVHDCSRPS